MKAAPAYAGGILALSKGIVLSHAPDRSVKRKATELFGYVRPLEPELKVREAASYKAHYCALCKAIGARFGLLARNALSYDCAFLALVLAAREEPQKAGREACIVNPLSRRPVMPESPSFDYAAAVNIVMAYGKLDDDWRDDKKLTALFGKGALNGAYRKALYSYPELGQAVMSGLDKLSALEREGCGIMDEAADAFAAMLASVFALPETGRERAAMEWLGYNIGKWIYLVDAFDDLEKDAAKGSYNVLLTQFQREGQSASDIRALAEPRVRLNLIRALQEAQKALLLLDFKSQRALIENIVEFGCRARTEQVLCGNKEECVDGSI